MRPERSPIALVAMTALTALAGPVGCDEGGSSGATPATSSSSPQTAGSTSASASASITAEAPPAHPLAGRWKASFQAARGQVDVREGIPYRPWVKDDGSASAGKGELSVEVAPDGAVTGSGAGALGALAIRGRIDGDTLRAGVTPVEAGAPDGMRGILVATKTGDDLVGELRVSSQDGTVVRVADVRFGRPPKK